MVNLSLLAGGYSTFIASYIFNTDANTLSLVSQSPSGNSPSWITLNPQNRSILFAVNELTDGAVQSFAVSNSGATLTPINTVASGGSSPAFTTLLSNGQVAVMNYDSGNGKIMPMASDGLHFDAASVISFPATVSHPHMALQNGNEVLVPDLGADKIWRLAQSGSNWQIQGFIQQPQGSGPRHAAIQNNFLFTLHELSSTLTSQPLPAAPNGTSSIISSLSIIPPNPPAGSQFAAAEILYPTTDYLFPGKFIYVSNRNTGTADPRGDAITIFSVNNSGELAVVDYVYTGLQQIRGMQFFGSDYQYLVAGGYESGGVAVFQRSGTGGNLTLVARNTQIQTATSFAWVY